MTYACATEYSIRDRFSLVLCRYLRSAISLLCSSTENGKSRGVWTPDCQTASLYRGQVTTFRCCGRQASRPHIRFFGGSCHMYATGYAVMDVQARSQSPFSTSFRKESIDCLIDRLPTGLVWLHHSESNPNGTYRLLLILNREQSPCVYAT